jgi:hypothetical protein
MKEGILLEVVKLKKISVNSENSVNLILNM